MHQQLYWNLKWKNLNIFLIMLAKVRLEKLYWIMSDR